MKTRKLLALILLAPMALLAACSAEGETPLPEIQYQPVDLLNVEQINVEEYQKAVDSLGATYDDSLDFRVGASYQFQLDNKEVFFNFPATEACDDLTFSPYETETSSEGKVVSIHLRASELDEECAFTEESPHLYYRVSAEGDLELSEKVTIGATTDSPGEAFFHFGALAEEDELIIYDNTPPYLQDPGTGQPSERKY